MSAQKSQALFSGEWVANKETTIHKETELRRNVNRQKKFLDNKQFVASNYTY